MPQHRRSRRDDLRGAFRLRGQPEGGPLLSLLHPGTNSLGASKENDVVVAATGVSRRHAVLDIDADRTLRVRDLGSKNGTWVNGVRIRECSVAPGDWVQLGPVALLVEEIDPDDAVVAIHGSGTVAADRGSPPLSETEGWKQQPAGRELAALSLLRSILPGIAVTGDASLAGPLADLAQEIGATGIALLHETLGSDPTVTAAWGDPAALLLRPGDAPAEQDGPAASIRSGFVAGSPPRIWASSTRGAAVQTIQAVGEELRESTVSRLVLEIVLSLVDRASDAPTAVRERKGLGVLRFPERHVAGRSASMQDLYHQLRLLLGADIPVLIVGETGVGKEHVADILHLSSPRGHGPFVAVNCAAIPSELLEAELFGIERGVATGVGERAGKFRLASGGTLFLDEIGDLPLPLQAKLLRALQAREIAPLGARRPVPVDVRVVTATNSDLAARVERSEFRRDLLYRIAGVTVRVPPLRERRADIPVLVSEFLSRASDELKRPTRGVTAKALRMLVEAPWPGNVRELEHEIRRLVALCPAGAAIDSGMLSESVCAPSATSSSGPSAASDLDLAAHVEALERHLLSTALARSRGNRTRAARLLGVSRPGLLMKMRRLGLE